MSLLQIRQPLVSGIREMSQMTTPHGFPSIAFLSIKKRLPRHNQMRCNVSLSVMVLSGTGLILWWNDCENRFERITITQGQVIDIQHGECFTIEGELSLVLTSVDPQPFTFQKISID